MAQTKDEQRVLDAVAKQLLIGGKWQDGSEEPLKIEDPATGETLCEVANAGPDQAMAALAAADEAQASWKDVAPRQRGEILRKAYDLMMERQDDLALLMTLEMGKSLTESKAEVNYAAEFFRWFSEEAVRISGRWSNEPSGNGRLLTMKQPVGPCLLITPWNFPAAMGTRKIGPAVAAGCTMVVKPAGSTPLTMLALGQILQECGLPDGVLNIITSSSSGRIIKPLIEDSRLRKLSFTGSTEVGRMLMEQASGQLLRLSMELGGNAPFLVFEDADLDKAVEQAAIAKMRNMGESCVAANRFHVHESIADEFTRRLADKIGSMKVGRGTEEGVDVGPLIDGDQRDKVAELVDDAVSKGAKVHVGGSKPDGDGYFYNPTVLGDVPAEARLLREEIFGPVAPVATFSTEEEALAAAMVGLNKGMISNPSAPFGGVKQSGFGREGGFEGIEEYLAPKYVGLDL
jgi:succinate-semialdehyde dehydrogenase/glutarate-semialdehyde dehydrogenase